MIRRPSSTVFDWLLPRALRGGTGGDLRDFLGPPVANSEVKAVTALVLALTSMPEATAGSTYPSPAEPLAAWALPPSSLGLWADRSTLAVATGIGQTATRGRARGSADCEFVVLGQ